MTVARLDSELVRQGLARSRRSAADLVTAGRVRVAGRAARKPAQPVPDGAVLSVIGEPADAWVSRAAHKLLGGLADTGVTVVGRRCLDAGASTGGFTQVLLAQGARHVVAVDVGHGQMADEVARDPRVTVREGVNVRDLTLAAAVPAGSGRDARPDLVVGDLSFISLRLVIAPLASVAAPGADLILLVKPQFEVGRERLGRGGVVTSPQLRTEAVVGVAEAAVTHGLSVLGAAPSRLPGEFGNHEHLLHLRAPSDAVTTPGTGSGARHEGSAEPAHQPVLPAEVRTALERSVQDGVVVRLGGAS